MNKKTIGILDSQISTENFDFRSDMPHILKRLISRTIDLFPTNRRKKVIIRDLFTEYFDDKSLRKDKLREINKMLKKMNFEHTRVRTAIKENIKPVYDENANKFSERKGYDLLIMVYGLKADLMVQNKP